MSNKMSLAERVLKDACHAWPGDGDELAKTIAAWRHAQLVAHVLAKALDGQLEEGATPDPKIVTEALSWDANFLQDDVEELLVDVEDG